LKAAQEAVDYLEVVDDIRREVQIRKYYLYSVPGSGPDGINNIFSK
jgi:hypothetical protein